MVVGSLDGHKRSDKRRAWLAIWRQSLKRRPGEGRNVLRDLCIVAGDAFVVLRVGWPQGEGCEAREELVSGGLIGASPVEILERGMKAVEGVAARALALFNDGKEFAGAQVGWEESSG